MKGFVNDHLTKILLSGIVLITIVVYLPGLDSRFIFDDYVNLGQLPEIKDYGYGSFVFSGVSGPSGRPLSLLTFALQYKDWPNNPYPFKVFNLVLHLLNGLLLYALMVFISRKFDGNHKDKFRFFPLIVTGFWLLHPMQVNTVLYVIQRMTELSTFFTLLGILGYLHAKEIFDQGRHKTGLIGMSFSVAAGVGMAVLSKENGILLPLYILVIEMTVLYNPARNRIWRIWAWIFLVSPLVILCLYLAYTLDHTLSGYQARSFTMSERLLTQPVVLVRYIQDLIIPHLDAFSLFHDDFPKSTSLFEPVKTLFCHLFIYSLAGYALIKRKQSGMLSLGILWFLAGQSLEASHVNLELYFEHRNYLPSVGVFILFSMVITRYWRVLSKYLMLTLIGAYFLVIVWIALFQVQVWNHPGRQAMEWALLHPRSPRALDHLGGMLMLTGNNEQALNVYKRILLVHPFDIYPYVQQILITYCIDDNSLPDNEWDFIYDKARSAKKYTNAGLNNFSSIASVIQNGKCPRMEIGKFIKLLIILANNKDYTDIKGTLYQIAAVLAAAQGDGQSALAYIDESIRYKIDAVRLIIKLRFMLSLENKEGAKEVLDMLKRYFQHHKMEFIADRSIVMELEEKLNKL